MVWDFAAFIHGEAGVVDLEIAEKLMQLRSKKPNVMGTYAPIMRIMVYDAIVAQVLTYNLIAKISLRHGVTLTDVCL